MQAFKPKLTFWFLLEAARHPAVELNKHCLISRGKSCPPAKTHRRLTAVTLRQEKKIPSGQETLIGVVTWNTTDSAPEKDVIDVALRSWGCAVPHIKVLQMRNCHTKIDRAWFRHCPKSAAERGLAKACLNHTATLSLFLKYYTFSELFFSLFC